VKWNNNARFFARAIHIVAALFFVSSKLQAQVFDTIRASFHSKPKAYFQIDAYNSFVSSEPANTFGLRAGLEFNKRVRITLGYYNLTSDIVKPKLITGVFANGDTTLNAKLDMSYFTGSFEYIFYNKDPWQFSVPLNIGAGKSYFWYYKNAAGDRGRIDEKLVMLTIFSVGAQYKILKWFGVGSGLGYRVMLKDNSNIDENFNSVIYSVGLRIFIGEAVNLVLGRGG